MIMLKIFFKKIINYLDIFKNKKNKKHINMLNNLILHLNLPQNIQSLRYFEN